jgi:hypothetical protein
MKGSCALLAAGLVAACSGHRQRPPGPPPEYERPVVMPWDAGAPKDPLDEVKGEEVTDDEPVPDAAAPPGTTDAGSGPLEPGTGEGRPR